MTSTLQQGDDLAATVQKTPNRVTLADIEANIAAEFCFSAGYAYDHFYPGFAHNPAINSLDVLTVCIIVLKNGFTLIGKSAPADAANFDREAGKKFARDDAMRQAWPLMGYALREKLAAGT